jgi:formylglycine-generating enzyme required for sulfatase activity
MQNRKFLSLLLALCVLAACGCTESDGVHAVSIKLNSKDGQTYVYIPAGSFNMGCSPDDAECGDSERPAHSVSITKGFWLGQTPVTQAAYTRVVGSNPSYFKGDKLPVEQVSWSEANHYCLEIGGRLPEDAEWEFAARAGQGRDRYGDLEEIAWYRGNSDKTTHPVGLKRPNSLGLYDMLGNVWQWTANWYGTFTQDGDDIRDPTDGDKKTVRGGSWFDKPREVRVSRRSFTAPANRTFALGFRCVGD